jgi:hypothetical protein
VIWPERRKAWIYTLDDVVEERDALVLHFPESLNLDATHLSIPLPDLWAELDDN